MSIGNRGKIGLFLSVLVVKLGLAGVFSSAYLDQLFIPFVSRFLSDGGNPWTAVGVTSSSFPYPPLMLMLLVPGLSLSKWIGMVWVPSFFVQHLLFKLPTIAADLTIAFLLRRWFPKKAIEILLFYWASPIILYAAYMHGQLDLIPTALAVLGTHWVLVRKPTWGGVAMGLAMATKFHVVVAVPLLFVYVVKRYGNRAALLFLLPIPWVVGALVGPYWSPEFVANVLQNPKQMSVMNAVLDVGALRIYLPLLVSGLLVIRFATFRTLNRDILIAFLAILFTLFVGMVPPSPGWYIWPLPFLSIFFIKFHGRSRMYPYLYIGLVLAYLVFFIGFYVPDYPDLSILGHAILVKIDHPVLRNLMFTTLELMGVVTIYMLYKVGIRSNQLYIRDTATVIGIGGDSGAGKSTLKTTVSRLLGQDALEIEGDGDHRWERKDTNWQSVTHLDPRANFLHRQANHLIELKNWRPIFRIDYNHDTGKFDPPTQIKPRRYIIFSGLHPFYLPVARRLTDIKIFIDTDDGLRRYWKVQRDSLSRSQTPDKVMHDIQKRAGDASRFIQPQRNFADLVIRFFPTVSIIDPLTEGTPEIQLGMSVNASIALDAILELWESSGVPFSWNYDEDLRLQTVVFSRSLDASVLDRSLAVAIDNLEDLIEVPVVWESGFSGVIQFFVLVVLAEALKGSGDDRS